MLRIRLPCFALRSGATSTFFCASDTFRRNASTSSIAARRTGNRMSSGNSSARSSRGRCRAAVESSRIAVMVASSRFNLLRRTVRPMWYWLLRALGVPFVPPRDAYSIAAPSSAGSTLKEASIGAPFASKGCSSVETLFAFIRLTHPYRMNYCLCTAGRTSNGMRDALCSGGGGGGIRIPTQLHSTLIQQVQGQFELFSPLGMQQVWLDGDQFYQPSLNDGSCAIDTRKPG